MEEKVFSSYFFLIKELDRSELPANWKLEKIEVFIKNLQQNKLIKFFSSVFLKVGILINRFVQFAGSETKQPGRNLSRKLKIVPNNHILWYRKNLSSEGAIKKIVRETFQLVSFNSYN